MRRDQWNRRPVQQAVNDTKISSIELSRWRQFEQIDLQFHPVLTVITGKNGSGKSTILQLLSKFYGWNLNFVSLPKKNKTKKLIEYLTGVWEPEDEESEVLKHIGIVTFTNGIVSKLCLPDKVQSSVYSIKPMPYKPIKGLHIHSHRPVFKHEQILKIPTNPPTRGKMYQDYFSQVTRRFVRGQRAVSNAPSAFHSLKANLISLATFGEGNSSIVPDKDAHDAYLNFQEILRIVLPEKIGFQKLKIHLPEVIMETKSGDFPLDSVSGGLASLIHICWQIFLYSSTQENFVVTFDEPENHLHPELQKQIIPNLIKAFPDVQFIIVTHSPLIIKSVQDAHVYAFDYNKNNRVFSQRIDAVKETAGQQEIIDYLLGNNIVTHQKMEEPKSKYEKDKSYLSELLDKHLASKTDATSENDGVPPNQEIIDILMEVILKMMSFKKGN